MRPSSTSVITLVVVATTLVSDARSKTVSSVIGSRAGTSGARAERLPIDDRRRADEDDGARQFVLTDGVVDERLDASEARLIDLLGGGDVRTEEQNQAGGGESDGGHWLDYTDGSTSPSAVGP